MRKNYKIIFRKKEVREGNSPIFLQSNLLNNAISDFCRSSWIDLVDISISDNPKKKCYIKVRCSKELYNRLLTYLKTSDLRHWIDVLK